MKSEMANKLKEILAQTSQEDFNKEWAEIEALNLEGPSADEVLQFFSANLQTTMNYEVESACNTIVSVSSTSYSIAA